MSVVYRNKDTNLNEKKLFTIMSLTQFSDSHILERFESSRYELLNKIGEGGFGKVFKARQVNTGQYVAIKFLAIDQHFDEQKKQRYIDRFKRETDLSSRLEHPNIVRLLNKGQIDEDLLYGVFEFVEGRSLREHLLIDGAFEALEATDIMLQVLDALIHAHDKCIVHRDIKPANIMLTRAGAKLHVKILDFGIGTFTQDNRQSDFRTLTLTQETLGTPSYSSPEQLRGEPATTKTDLYVWGLVFLECLTGSPAMNGTSVAAIYHKQLSEAHIPLPSAILSHPISELLRRVLKKDVSERVVTGAEIFDELKSTNMSNLVGLAAPTANHPNFDDETVVFRPEDATALSSASIQTVSSEKKQITVLAIRFSTSFVDNRKHDLEVLDTLFKSQRNHFIDVASRFGAYHVGSISDTSLFYFGYPASSDNDARLCARSALEILSELATRNALMREAHGAQLNIHIGMHTGMFLTYANATPEGYVASAAMTLARTAKEKQILCSNDTTALLEPFCELEQYVQLKLGQTYHPEQVFSLIGERKAEAFGFLRGTRSSHEFIGRQQELAQIQTVFNGIGSDNRFIHIEGEAGMGKSRLLLEITNRNADFAYQLAQCLPEHQNNALYPILNLVKHKFGLEKLSSHEAYHLFKSTLSDKIEQVNLDQALSSLLIWLNIKLDGKQLRSPSSAQMQKELLFLSLYSLLFSLKSFAPKRNCLVIEDLHWADNTTLEFLKYATPQLTSDSVVIATSREKLPKSLANKISYTSLTLAKLSEPDAREFISKLFSNKPVSNELHNTLISRADGVPLFIEELVGMLKQKEYVELKHGEYCFSSPEHIAQVPLTLRESLQSNLESLGFAKDTVQRAALLGREFEHQRLFNLVDITESQLSADLQLLVEQGILVKQRQAHSDNYIFRHALIKDVSYDSIDKNHLIKWHLKAAKVIEQEVTQDPTLSSEVARHYEAANDISQARLWYYKSAKYAEVKYSLDEAITFFDKTLTLSESQKLNSDDIYLQSLYRLGYNYSQIGQQEKARIYLNQLTDKLAHSDFNELTVQTYLTLGKTFEIVHQHGDALEQYEIADNILETLPHTESPQNNSWWQLWLSLKSAQLYVNYWLGNKSSMSRLVDQTSPVVELIGTDAVKAKFYDDLLHLKFRENRYILGDDDLHIAQLAENSAKATADTSLYAYALFVNGFSLSLNKRHDAAIDKLNQAIEIAKKLNDKVTLTRCITYQTISYRLAQDVDKTLACATLALKYSQETDMDDYKAAAHANLAWVAFKRGNPTEAIEQLECCFAIWEELSKTYSFPFSWIAYAQLISLSAQDPQAREMYQPKLKQICHSLCDVNQMFLGSQIQSLLETYSKNSDNQHLIDITDALIQSKYL
ncbi:protein kinase [Pseudoalteromonas luteoviolacea 2ta16]|uniref:Protein kinase n=2 Tax=Pseudoalteromonas luteoviolacea TaxID=43657 RepID=V4J6P0_PSEL2|nr:protein kinase [Pseudoalteromonas luteoviolacea 2ta16]